MSVRDFPSADSESRQDRAEDVSIEDVRVIDTGEQAVYEMDLTNEEGERRENVTVIPSILFESTKDVEHRHDKGIVGKYSRALAMENADARAELLDAIEEKREEIQAEMRELQEKDSRLLHSMVDIEHE